ncbi:hypothetical protein KEH51_02250 [[Brevibacterium] frigoritolerans]|uniref:Uncharacterized protein n=1 Tax=Peribacillus frigoritolerans TaxID=450367 RepID=A0A941J1Z4_9BACI|nr:hypothetical protein [Peribacillus frigoritolerans]
MADSRRKGRRFWNQLERFSKKKTADIAVIELMSFNLYKNKKIMKSENNEKNAKLLVRFYNELPEYYNICCIVVKDYDIGKGSVLVISIMRG